MWLVAVAALGGLGLGVDERLSAVSIDVPGTPSAEAREMLERRFGESVSLAVLLEGPAAELDRQGPALVAAFRRTGDVRVLSPWDGERPLKVLRPEPSAALVVLDFRRSEEQALTTVVPEAQALLERTIRPPVSSHLNGLPVVTRAIRDAMLDATKRAELLALPVLIVVLLLVFRTPVAAAVPLAMGAATVFAGRGVLYLVTYVIPINSLAVAVASMMGLALGVDYALLMVSRYRQERESGADHAAAVAVAGRVSGRTIVFAGGTLAAVMVTAALGAAGGLLASTAVGVVVAGLLSVLLAISAMPALLLLCGSSLERWRLPMPTGGGRLIGLSERFVARPMVAIPLVLALVGALAVPAFALEIGPPDVRQLPAADPVRQSFEAMERAVGPGWSAPLTVVATARDGVISEPRRLRALARWQARVARDPGVVAVIGPASLGGQREMARVREEYRTAPKRLESAESALWSLRDGLWQASAGVSELRAGLATATAAADRIAAGAHRGERGAARLEAGLARAGAGSRRLSRGLGAATRGADRLIAGQRRLSSGADELARGAGQLDDSVQAALQRMRTISDQLRAWARWIAILGTPARLVAAQLERAQLALEEMTVGRQDPRYAEVRAFLQGAREPLGGASGGGGLLSTLAQIEEQMASSVRTLEALPDEVERLAAGITRLRSGADQLAAGSERSEQGTRDLRDGLRRLTAGSRRLTAGIDGLHGGAGSLRRGAASIAAGAESLSSGLADGHRRSAPLEEQLTRPRGPLARYAMALHGYGEQHREFDTRFPGAIDSGYLFLAALDGAVPGVRDQIAQAVNVDSGGQAGRTLVVLRSAPNTPGAERTGERVRDTLPALARASDSDVAAGQGVQALIDYRDATLASLPMLVLALSLVATVTLVLVLRALLLPIVAVLLTLVTIAAAFGALELLSRLDLFGGPGYIDSVSAVGIFAIMFVLAIDYEVFLLARMREEWLASGDHDGAITCGVRHTAGVITGAAAIMSAVFLAFAAAGLSSLSQFGAGLTVAVLLDATVVRLILLPAVMRALGPRAWWLPAWLERMLPHLDHGERPQPERPRRPAELVEVGAP